MVYLGFCSRIHEREQSVRDGERVRERTEGEWAPGLLMSEEGRPEERKELVSEKGWQNVREVEARREEWIVGDCS